MRIADTLPSVWTGVAAARYPFGRIIDYSAWACSLLEKGHISNSICVLAGLFAEDDRTELSRWHRRALRDLGCGELSERDLFLSHLRGGAEEFLAGSWDFREVAGYLAQLESITQDELLRDFRMLHYGYWDFGELDLSDLGIATLEDFPRACADACRLLLSEIRSEYRAAPGRIPQSLWLQDQALFDKFSSSIHSAD